jgi:hypothetical protein
MTPGKYFQRSFYLVRLLGISELLAAVWMKYAILCADCRRTNLHCLLQQHLTPPPPKTE